MTGLDSGAARDVGDVGGDEGFGTDRLRAAALHQIQQYVMVFSGPEHTVVALNAAILQLFDGFDPMGLRLGDFLVGVEAQGVIDILDRAHAGEPAVLRRMRYAIRTPEGYRAEIVVDFEANPLRDRNGLIVGTTAIGRDITAQVAREAAEQAETADLTRRYRRATDVVEEVQRALLPGWLPVLPGVDVAASYSIAGSQQAAGGDWFDVVALPDGTVAAVVGDVVGHGIAAAAVMAQLRAVTLERLHAGTGVAGVVDALDRFVQLLPEAHGSTICVAVVDPVSGAVQYCAAAHPPPLVTRRGGASGYLDPGGDGPIGVPAGQGRRALRAQLEGDEVLLLYTDGVIELPGVPVTAGTVELRRVAEAALADDLLPAFSEAAAVDRSTGQVLERLTRETGSADDITLLALARRRPLEPLRAQLDASRAPAAQARTAVRAWFRPGQVDERSLGQLDQILTELCENATEHAYDFGPGPIELRADLDAAGQLTVTVTDQGPWRPRSNDPQAGRGLGLAVIQQMAVALSVDHQQEQRPGTTVTVTFRPGKRSRNSTLPQPTASTFADVVLHAKTESNTVQCHGPIDADVLGELNADLALCTVIGSPPLALDLNEVTMLSSSAISTIRRSLTHADNAGVPFRVLCQVGSVAQQVLTLAGIDTAA